MKKVKFLSILLIPILFLAFNYQNFSTTSTHLETCIDKDGNIKPACKQIWYYKCTDGKNGHQYYICKDRDGWRVRIPGGNKHNYGNGYTKDEVMERYDLKDKHQCKYRDNWKTCECN